MATKSTPRIYDHTGPVKLRAWLLFIVLCLSLLPLQVVSADPGDIDTNFLNPSPTGGSYWTGSGSIGSMLEQPDGKIIIAGRFSEINGHSRSSLARLNGDGSLDTEFARFFNVTGDIYTMIFDGDKILIGGNFTKVGSTSVARLARLNSDGSLDITFTSPFYESTSTAVNVIVPVQSGYYVAGGFSQVSGYPCGNIARLSKSGAHDNTFMAGTNGRVLAIDWDLTDSGNPKILIGGMFTTVNGVDCGRLARVDTSGTLDTDFMSGKPGADDIVSAIAVQPDGKYVVGGYFKKFNGQQTQHLVRLQADGTIDTIFNNGSPDDTVRAISLRSSGKMLITGYFSNVDGQPRGKIALLDSNGYLDSAFMASQSGANDSVLESLIIDGGTKLLVSGGFTQFNGNSRNMIACLVPATGYLDHNCLNPGANDEITAVEVQPEDGKILIGGPFEVVNGLRQAGISRLNSDGTTDQEFFRNMSGVFTETESGPARVDAIALQPDAKILIGGTFTKAHVTGANNIIRINPNGTTDSSFATNGLTGSNVSVYKIAIQPDGKILAAGNFTTADGQSRTNIARFNTNGLLDTSFNPPSIDKIIYSIALQTDGKIVIVGEFTEVGGVARGRVARLLPDGSLDTGYLNGSGADNMVRWVELDSQGNAIIGGWFTDINGIKKNRIARLSSINGNPDPTFQPSDSLIDNGIRSLELLPNGLIMIGGEFTQVYGTPSPRLARLTENGALDPTFTGPNLGPTSGGAIWVNDIAVQTNADSLIVGNFRMAENLEYGRIARLLSEIPVTHSIYLPTVLR